MTSFCEPWMAMAGSAAEREKEEDRKGEDEWSKGKKKGAGKAKGVSVIASSRISGLERDDDLLSAIRPVTENAAKATVPYDKDKEKEAAADGQRTSARRGIEGRSAKARSELPE
jgi:hypothetical protein